MDLMALADALLLPDDDLALATVLKSPLFGLTEEQIFTLAWDRKKSLRATLRARANEMDFVGANARLDRYAEWARHLSPFAFYARILGPERGRASFYARLGAEAADALDEFLELALLYERGEAPTLQGFVAWLRAGQTEVKRDMDIARDEVRVMTVHGAKGLEAPIVVLADTVTPPKGPKEPRLLRLPVANAAPDTPDRIVWAGRKADDVRAGRGCARESGRRGRGRIPAAPLCGDDAGGRPAGGGGLARREPRSAGLLVRADRTRAESGGDRGAGRRWRRQCVSLAQVGRHRAGRGVHRSGARARTTSRVARAQRAGGDRAACHLAIPDRPCRRAARGHRRSAARWRAAGPFTASCRRCLRCRRNAAPRPRASIWLAPRISTPRSTTRFCARSSRSSTMHALHRCSPKTRAPRCRSSVLFHRMSASRARSIALR